MPVFLVVFLGVTCRLTSAAQPAYNHSGAANKQGQSASLGKDRTDDPETPTGPPTTRYSGSNSKEPYYDDYYERPGKQFSARSVSSSYPMMAAVSASQVGFPADSDYAATGHGGGHGHSGGGHGHGGHSGGGGGGWGTELLRYHESVSKVDNSSLGLLGLLGLLSLLSNVLLLITTTTTAAPAGRRRREVDPFTELQLDSENKVEEICQRVLPSLNVIGHVQNGKIPVNCSHQEVCTTNQILVNEFGIQGRTVGSMLSKAIVKMLKEVNQSPAADKYLLQASLDGRNGENCERAYPTCRQLEKGKHSLSQLVSPEQVTAIVLRKNPRLIPSSN
ncbi:hypothetical protein Fcan01_05951 [Folsomia candida]|uniref:Uncharacterized protein n=1 Tax=Folsomia candida TaxID=158441 RepID=A0A226ES31_FOLCA|nr:hypothetical protein Fcan01_05951 [Folsomia candida]